jgi:thiol-disulfide isomerase/thioredoxin
VIDKKRILVLLGSILGVGLLGSSFLSGTGSRAGARVTEPCEALGPRPMRASLRPGQEAPHFELSDASGKKWSLQAFRGRPVLLNFWATWCAPCVEEMPWLESLSRRMEGRAKVLTVSVDESWEAVKSFFPRGTSLSVLLDGDKAVAGRFATTQFPETFLIDGAGRVQLLYHQARWDSSEGVACLDSLR